MSQHDHEHSHDKVESSPRQRRWLRVIAGGSMVIGLAQGVVGGAALRVDGAHNLFGDSVSYGLKDLASTQHHDLRPTQVRRRLKMAGLVLCVSSLFGVAEAAHDAATDSQHTTSGVEVGLAAVSLAYGAFSARKLHGVGTDLAHEHGVRHGLSDVLSSSIVVVSAVAASQGVPYADAVGAVSAASVTIGFNYPTEQRLSNPH